MQFYAYLWQLFLTCEGDILTIFVVLDRFLFWLTLCVLCIVYFMTVVSHKAICYEIILRIHEIVWAMIMVERMSFNLGKELKP
jgi:hypothetical protein